MHIEMKTIKRVHLIIMVLTLIPNFIIALGLLAVREPLGVQTKFGTEGLYLGMVLAAMIAEGFSMVCGIVYVLRDYRKTAADYYKFMMLLYVISKFFLMYSTFVYGGLRLSMLANAAEVVILSMLTFGKDLGRQRTMSLFYALLSCELILSLLGGFAGAGVATAVAGRLTSALMRVVLAGTVGLAIKGKYEDKSARGTF